MFLGEIAFMLELFGFCIGLILLHKAASEGGLVRAAGIILLIGSIFLGLCTLTGAYERRAFIEKEFMKHEIRK